MRRVFSVALILLACAWLLASVGLKVLRDHRDGGSVEAQAERAVEAFLAAHGWSLAGRARVTASGLYHAQVFGKPGCDRQMLVISLGATLEALAMIEGPFGGDVAYLVGGRFSSTLSTFDYKARALVAGLNFMRQRVLPILAVSPPPPQAPAGCQPPAAPAWRRLSAPH